MLVLETLGKTYADGTQALESVSLPFGPGEIVALVGGSGCGKTTLIRLVAGLDVPSGGRILLDDVPVGAASTRVGVVFQEPRLLPWLSVADNIGSGLKGVPRVEREARIERALQAIDLPGYGTRWPRELSGGQAQRVALARSLVPRPRVLLLDEPFSALDAVMRATLQAQLLSLWAEQRPILLVATHDVDEAVSLADRIVVMRPRPGRIGDVLRIDLPRPRHRRALGFETASSRVLDRLEQAQRPPGPAADIADGAGLWW